MRTADLTPNFVGQRAAILHRPHAVVDAIVRQLEQLGIRSTLCWPELAPDAATAPADLLFFDADMGHDGQFPWPAGTAPMPTIALIGSEAPGRLAWALRQGADAHLLKPVGSGGIYAALVIATSAFRQRTALQADLAGLRDQLAGRQVVAEATAQLMAAGAGTASVAYDILRQMAMSQRVTIEIMAARLVHQEGEHNDRRSRA